MGLVHTVADRYLGRGVEREDLVQVASLGLLRALRGFDESRGLAFSTYAVIVIEGQVRDYLRGASALRVSRSVRTHAARLSRAQAALGEGATLAACAEAAGLTQEEAALAADAFTQPVSLAQWEEGGREIACTESGYDAVLDSVLLSDALGKLEKREANLVRLRYFHGLTQSRTARVLNLTQVQVSRAEKRILQKLRALLSK